MGHDLSGVPEKRRRRRWVNQQQLRRCAVLARRERHAASGALGDLRGPRAAGGARGRAARGLSVSRRVARRSGVAPRVLPIDPRVGAGYRPVAVAAVASRAGAGGSIAGKGREIVFCDICFGGHLIQGQAEHTAGLHVNTRPERNGEERPRLGPDQPGRGQAE